MFKTEKILEHSVICSPITKILPMILILRPAQQFEFDMPAVGVPLTMTNRTITLYSAS
jgi:hypothetical protein